jgi:(p)ppGpp synthase/HD superfamily hydrolase
MSNTPSLETTIQFALDAHRGQVDRYGQPFIVHPLRLMLSLPLHDLDAQIVALLHDVVEDTPYTLDDLRQRGYAEAIIEAVDCLTRRETETYEEFIQRIKPNALARRVKLADLRDNMNLLRLPTIDASDAERLGRYRAAWRELTGE